MKQLRVGPGRYAMVDDEDFADLAEFRWQTVAGKNTWYACGRGWRKNEETGLYGPTGLVYMHRLVMKVKDPKVQVDHKDGNGLNNQKANLRLATNQENAGNAPARKGTSKFKGVSWDAQRQRWRAHITVDRRGQYLGLYASEEEAARAYDEAARKNFGWFARTNFPKEGE